MFINVGNTFWRRTSTYSQCMYGYTVFPSSSMVFSVFDRSRVLSVVKKLGIFSFVYFIIELQY
jgi:hypothetical protein